MILCVTGRMAAGKNAVSEILEKNGFLTIDADKVVHEILFERSFQEKVIFAFERFAEEKDIELRNQDGTLNRRNLGALIFSDKRLLALQERIVLPEVENRILQFIKDNESKNLVINATVLYKIPCVKKCDAIIFVDAPFFTRFKRAKKRDKMKTMQILQRFWNQLNLFSKYKKSNADTYRVKNSKDLLSLEENVMKIIKKLGL